MNIIESTITKLDNFQRRHQTVGFVYAVFKKYGEDNGSYQSALITYYGLLSLFPLLVVLTSLAQLLVRHNAGLRLKVATSITHYFPIIGSQLQQSIQHPAHTGLALLFSLIIMFYGARGGASAFQYAMNSLWQTSPLRQPPFLQNLARSLGIMFVGGVGLVSATTLSGYSTTLGPGLVGKLGATALSVLILSLTLTYLFKLALAGNKSFSEVYVSALLAAIGVQVLQTIGTALLGHELKNLKSEYGTFALVIGLLFWLYLQAQVILYAVEIDIVRQRQLYPRSLQGSLIDSDRAAYTKYAKATRRHDSEHVKVKFRK